MLSFENHDNYPICAVQDSKGKEVAQLYLHDKKKHKDAKNTFTELTISDDHKIIQIPNLNKERDVIYVAGMSGSGKSYYIKEYVLQYIKQYPKRPIFLFSYLSEDETLDKVKKIQRVDINNADFMNTKVSSSDFKNSLVIFDDIDCIANKKLKEKVMNLLQQLLQIARHDFTTVAFACHEIRNGHETKSVLNECHSITMFPATMGTKKLRDFLEDFFGMDKTEIERFRNIDSRAVTIIKSYPKVIFGEHEIYIL